MNWPMLKLGEVAPAEVSKHSFATDAEVWALNLDQVEPHTGTVLKKIMVPASEAGVSTHGFDERHVLYSKLRPYLNKVVLPDEAGLATTELVPLMPDPSRLDRRYLACYLRSKKFLDWVSAQVAGAKMPRVSMQSFWQHEMPVPPLSEQQRIVTILEKAEAIRRKRQRATQLSDDFLRTAFLELFGDPVTNQKGWPVEYLPDMGSFKNGLNYAKEEAGVTVNFLGVGDFKSLDRIEGVNTLSTIQLDAMPAEDYLLADGDLVFVRSNGNKALVGRCLAVYPGDENLTFSGFCIRFRLSSERLTSEYLNYLFRVPSIKNEMLKGGQGANIQNINQKILSEMAVPVPPLELQNKFITIVDSFKRLQAKIGRDLDEVNDLFNAIVGKAISGQL